MDEREIIRTIMQDMNFNHKLLAEQCGYSSHTSISNKLNAPTMTVESLYKMLQALGCELVIRKGDKEYVVSHSPEDIQKRCDFDLGFDKILSEV